MKKESCGVFSGSLILGLLLVPAMVFPQSAERVHDPVVIRGILLSQMTGEDPADLRLFACREGRMIPIPYQVDERMDVTVYKSWTKRRGISTYVFNAGSRLKSDPDPGFDRDDELAFMARDMGEKAEPQAMPASARQCEEIETYDPETGESRYAYLCSFDNPPSPSDCQYVYFGEALNEFISESYRLGYPDENPMVFDRLYIRRNGQESPDLLDAFKMEIELYAVMGVVAYELTNDDYQHFLRGMKIGPIRIIKEMETVFETWFNAQVRVINRVIYYPDHVEITLMSRTPVYWGNINDANYKLTLDMSHESEGMKFFSQNNPAGVTIDGILDQEELDLDYGPTGWVAASGKHGTIYSHLQIPSQEGLSPEKILYPDLYYADAEYKGDPPEEERGMFGKFGFIVRHLQRTGKKPVPFRLAYLFSPGPHQPGREDDYLAMYQDPLQVAINHHLAKALPPTPAPRPDTRKPEQKPGPPMAPKKQKVVATRFFAPSFMLDPYYLGNGIGISYADVDFLRTGVFFNLLTLTSDRNFHWYMIDFQKLQFVSFVEDFRIFAQFQQFPSEGFYGIGNESEKDHKTLYWWKRYEAFVTFRKHFADHYGMNTQIFYRDVEVDPGQKARGIKSAPSYEERFGFDDELIGVRWGGPLYGHDGGVSNGIAVSFYRDFRDDYQCPHRGNYQEIKFERVGPEMGSDFNYLKLWLDMRAYAEPGWLNPLFFDDWASPRRTFLNKFIGPEKHRSLAGRIRFGRIISEEIEYESQDILNVPFYELMAMGGSSTHRGYYSSRFRDNDIALLSLEYRWVYWRFTDMALFYDLGMVMDDMFDEDSWDNDLHAGYGISIRMHIPPGVMATFEYGFSDEIPGGWILQANWVF